MSTRPRWRAVVLGVALVAVCATGLASTAAAQSDEISADNVVVTIDVQPSGDAIWSMEYQYVLTTENETQGFERLRSKIHENRESYTADVRADFARTVQVAENQTGRSMTVTDVSVGTSRQPIPQDTGMVVHRFQWTNFAVANDTHVLAGDAIREFYLGPDTTMTVTWPAEYEPVEMTPPPDESDGDEATWSGGGFEADQPRMVFARTPSDTGGLPVTALLGLAGVALVVAGLGGAIYVRLNDLDGGRLPVGDRGDPPARPPPELLSDEERVRHVLEHHGGRVKQQTIAEECDWGASKTSKVVTELHEEDVIDRFRIGRENVISLPDDELDQPE